MKISITKDKKNILWLIVGGLVIGVISSLLVLFGNPKNMGFCNACFIRDIAGSMKLHSAPVVQYFRPEIIGLIIGSFAIAMIKGEFKPRGGSSPFLRFVISICVMIGALAFLGCPFRMILRLAGGDQNALIGLLGFIVGIAIACFFINNGFSLGATKSQKTIEGAAFPAFWALFFVIFKIVPSIFAFSEKGPGSMHAPIILALIAGLIVAVIAQRARLCMVGGIRDTFLLQDCTLLVGFAAIYVGALVMNLILTATTGNSFFSFGFTGQPVAHRAQLWNFLGMLVVGLGSAMLGGCPLRQIVLAGEGNTDSAISFMGMLVGAAFAHNFGLAGSAMSADSIGGPGTNGKVAVVISIVLLLAIASVMTFRRKK